MRLPERIVDPVPDLQAAQISDAAGISASQEINLTSKEANHAYHHRPHC